MKKSYFIVILIFIGIIYYIKTDVIDPKLNYDNIYLEENTVSQLKEPKETKIKVYVVGEILNPGIYEINEDSRIDDVIKIAGGPTADANLNIINLACEVSDGEKIYIPSISDEDDEYNVSNDVNKSKKVNINKANLEELQTINGLGEALAERIINYRKENGKFSSIEDLKNVSGIGEKKFESIKDFVDVK